MLSLLFGAFALGIQAIAICITSKASLPPWIDSIDGLQLIDYPKVGEKFLAPLFSRRSFSRVLLSIADAESFLAKEVTPFYSGAALIDYTRHKGKSDFTLTFEAGSFGYVDQLVQFDFAVIGPKAKHLPKMPEGILSQQEEGRYRFHWQGSKPMPPKPRLESGAALPFIPDAIVKERGRGALRPSRPFASAQKIAQGKDNRFLLDTEALFLLGYPRSLRVRDLSASASEAAKRALPVVLGFPNVHAIAFLLWFAILVGQTVQAASIKLSPDFAYCPVEAILRDNIRGTCWDPSVKDPFPGVMNRSMFIAEMSSIFDGPKYSAIDWDIPLDDKHIANLQTFWIFTQLRGAIPHSQGPDWCSQKRKAASMAALGMQRSAGASNRGLDHMFPPGLGPEEHMRCSFAAPSPMSLNFELDEDLNFAIEAAAVWGPFLQDWRKSQLDSLSHLKKCLHKVNVQLVACMDPYVRQVAAERSPAGIAAIATLLRWPDRNLARCFVEGFPVIGEVEESNVFKRLPDSQPDLDLGEKFFGVASIHFINELIDNTPKHQAKLIALVQKEIDKGRFFNEMSRAEADTFFGRGKWRPMPLFVIEQALKDRLISDARRGGHNEAVHEIETIFVPSIDFIPEVLRGLSSRIRASTWCSHTEPDAGTAWLPPWAQPMMGTEDLDEAYGQCPARPDQRGACVVAWHCPSKGWRFAEAKGLVFGLSAAVVGFNRWPLLITAAFRRLLAGLGTNYFDDFCILSMLLDATSARDGLSKVADICGGSFGTGKTVPPGTTRPFIGVYADLQQATLEGKLIFRPREECLRSIKETALHMLRSDSCSPSAASKLRGKAGWASTHLFAKIGRIGMSALKARQYYGGKSYKLNSQLREALSLLIRLHEIPPKLFDMSAIRLPPLIIYSDASWPSRMDGAKETTIPRIGWVIFDPHRGTRPQGFSMTVSESILSRLIVREQQILAVEAFAAAAAPWISRNTFAMRDSIWFVDNSAAVSTLIRGSAKPEDIDNLSALVTLQNAIFQHSCWFEWIDSDSNPSDGLSRLGLEDPWTTEQGWELHDVSHVDWTPLFEAYAFDTLAASGKIIQTE